MKTQYPGDNAARAVNPSPIAEQPSKTDLRPRRSASADSGNPPSAARRITPSPSPNVVADNPSSAATPPPLPSPNAVATSPSAVKTPNWAKPEATDSAPAARIAGWRQP